MLTYSPLLNTMKKHNKTFYALSHQNIISHAVAYRIRNNKPITLNSLHALCEFFKCEITDIIAYIPDNSRKTRKDVPIDGIVNNNFI